MLHAEKCYASPSPAHSSSCPCIRPYVVNSRPLVRAATFAARHRAVHNKHDFSARHTAVAALTPDRQHNSSAVSALPGASTSSSSFPVNISRKLPRKLAATPQLSPISSSIIDPSISRRTPTPAKRRPHRNSRHAATLGPRNFSTPDEGAHNSSELQKNNTETCLGGDFDAQAEEMQRSHIERKIQQRQGAAGADGLTVKTIKSYAPVARGHVLVPGGREWAGLRRRLKYRERPSLPVVQPILMVEGESDMESVTRAVNAVVYVFKGSRMRSPAGQEELAQLKQLAQAGNPLLILTDPDKAGRAFRLTLDDMLGPCMHAFMPEPVAITPQATWFKQAGNRGVEHANPQAVIAALSSAVTSYGPKRKEFTREDMIRLQLLNGGGSQPRIANVELRRRIVCALLGLGECDGSQLQAALNRYFSQEQLAYVLNLADSNMQRLGIQLGGAEIPKNCEADETELVLSLA